MNELVTLRGVGPNEILQTAIDKKVSAIMSFLSRGKWHVAKVRLTALGADRFSIESIHSTDKPHPINIQVNQPVGISFKYDYGKFIFDTTVLDLEPLSDSIQEGCGGTIVLAVPDHVEMVQRRSYFRVNVHQSLKVSVVLWHRTQKSAFDEPDTTSAVHHYFQGRLVDISAGGAQVEVDAQTASCDGQPSSAQEREFRNGQFVGLRFTPLPYETPLVFNAQIRRILPAADHRAVYLGLQIVGLESSYEGRQVLARIVGVVERYYQMNQQNRKQAQPAANAV
jgi:hypothetical protein